MKPTMRVPLLLTLYVAMAAGGCATSSPTITTKTVMIAVPEVRDTLQMYSVSNHGWHQWWEHDSLYGGHLYDTTLNFYKIVQRDTVVKIRWYPKRDTLLLWLKPDSVRYQDVDTTKKVIQLINHIPTIWQKFTYAFIGIGIVAVALVILLLINKLPITKL